ncbi:nitroreductase family protein [Mycobacterium sp. MBM]|nr:nitroreductase family protein [Mycobacterium sp. MBM]
MSAHHPDAETVQAALALAVRAPSIHNSQPWRWRVGPHSLHLYADRTLHLAATDPDGRDLILSCGLVLDHCAVALAALGWQAKIHRFPTPADRDHLASVEYSRHRPTEVDIALAAAIPTRRTDRRQYSSWPVPPSHIATMGARAARMGAAIRRVDNDAGFRSILKQAETLHRQDDAYMRELAAWTGRHAATLGVAARNTPKPEPGPSTYRLFVRGELTQPGATPEADNGVVLALGTESDDDLARLRAGEAASQIVLTATSQGLASCFVTEPLELVPTRDALQASTFGPSRFPQMLLRIGWAPVNAEPLSATSRRPLAEVVSRLDGTPFDLVG